MGLAGQVTAPAQVSALPVLREVRQIRVLTREQARMGYPVHLRATVTYFDEFGPNWFIKDATGGQWVQWEAGMPKPEPGQRIEIDGITRQTGFGPDVGHPRWKVLGKGALPDPEKVSYEQMASTTKDGQWVETEGIVRGAYVESKAGLLRMVLSVNGNRVMAQTPVYDRVPLDLVDARIRIRGNCGAIFNQKSQFLGPIIHMPSLGMVTLLKAPPARPFDGAAVPIGDLLRFGHAGAAEHRLHISGTITAVEQNAGFFVTDGAGSLHVETSGTAELRAGDTVDVLGFPSVADERPSLVESTVRVLRRGAAPAPARIATDQALDGRYDSVLVTIEGRLKFCRCCRKKPSWCYGTATACSRPFPTASRARPISPRCARGATSG